MVTSTSFKKQVTLATANDAVATLIHVQQASDIVVIRTRAAVDTTLTIGSSADYTVSDVGVEAGCTVTFIGQAIGDFMTIRRSVPLTQTGNYVSNTKFPPETNEDGHDKSRMIDQQIQEELDRSLKFPPSEDETAGAQELPLRSVRKNKYFAFDAAGDPTVQSLDEILVGTGSGSRTYSMAAGSTLSPCLSIVTIFNTSTEIEIHGVVNALGSHRIRKYLITDMSSESTTIISNTDNILGGKTGAEAVDFTIGAIGKLVNINLVGTALTATRDVTVKIIVKTTKTPSDLIFYFSS